MEGAVQSLTDQSFQIQELQIKKERISGTLTKKVVSDTEVSNKI